MGKFILAVFAIVTLNITSDAISQTLWGLEVADQSQYDSWENVNGAKQKADIDFWGVATYKDGVLEMNKSDGKDADFQSAFIELVMNYGQPSLFNDRNIMLDKEKHREDSIKAYIEAQKKINIKYKHPKDKTVIVEDTRNVDQMVADGDMVMRRNWILVDYEIELAYDQYGLRFKLKYLK